jgi:hypothetical protein
MLRWRSHSLWFNLPFLVCAWLSLLSSAGLAQSSGAHEAGQGREPGLIGPVNHRAETQEPSTLPKDRSGSLDWENGRGRSYLIPATEVLTYLFLLNQYDRHFTEPKDVYRTTGTTIREHLTDSKWVFDNDQFSVNQFLHPYGGSVYFGLARSAGLSFWESSLYSVAGSFLWEIGGERTSPSINDMITTPIGGAFLGEPLFRMANLSCSRPDAWPAGVLARTGRRHHLAAHRIQPPRIRQPLRQRVSQPPAGHLPAAGSGRHADVEQSQRLLERQRTWRGR